MSLMLLGAVTKAHLSGSEESESGNGQDHKQKLPCAEGGDIKGGGKEMNHGSGGAVQAQDTGFHQD